MTDAWGFTASTPVGRILQDADKLDGMGLCGLFRIAGTWLPEVKFETLLDRLYRRDVTSLTRQYVRRTAVHTGNGDPVEEPYYINVLDRMRNELDVCIGWAGRMQTSVGKQFATLRVARLIGFRSMLESC